jgi:hypothetical protein
MRSRAQAIASSAVARPLTIARANASACSCCVSDMHLNRPPNVPPFSCAGTLKATLRRRSNARQAAVPSEARSAAAGDNATGAGASCNGLLGSKPMIATVDTETKHRSSPGYSRNAGSSSGAQKPERSPIAKGPLRR